MRVPADQCRYRFRRRCGASLVEGAFVLNVLLVVLFGMLDLALAALHHNSLSETARLIAREAIVRGRNAPPSRTEWGPAIYIGDADDATEISDLVRSASTPTDYSNIAIRLEWPDANNDVDDRVRVELNYPYTPLVPFVLGLQPCQLHAESIMRITH